MRLYDLIAHLTETPIQDYKTVGNFDKNSSFRNPRDRHLITNQPTIDYVKRKFSNNNTNFNLTFVNSPKANRHTEVGMVSPEWILENLGQEVHDAVMSSTDTDDSVNVVFTNNKGTQGKPMTAWIMAHRIAHVLARPSRNYRGKQFQSYTEAANILHSYASEIMELYGRKNIPTTWDKMAYRNGYGSDRPSQLSFLHFMTKLCTFRSARENVVRDWFEILHELFAQYITTGKITFNAAPKWFGTNQTGKFYLKDEQEANDLINQLSGALEEYFDELLREATGTFLVM